MLVTKRYEQLVSTPSDINEHLPTLYRYAQTCDTIAELGVRDIVSTWAFIKGLSDNKGGNRRLYSVDLCKPPQIEEVAEIAREAGVDLTFYESDSATVEFSTPVDLLFIDTWHVYAHLKRELKHHVNATSPGRYIILHDTEVDKDSGESIREGMDIRMQSKRFGYPEDEIRCGLKRAVDEFLEAHRGTWVIREHFPNNNGLTVLERA